LGLCSKKHVILAAVKRSHNILSSYQEKIFEIDSHMGIAISGLTSDARALAMHMRLECLNYRFAHAAPIITGRLVSEVAEMHQRRTMQSWSRPYGVGLLVAGYDANGPHLYETDPSGVYSEYYAIAIGARSQSSRTYFEHHMSSFKEASLEELTLHALRALQGSANDTALTNENVSIAIIGENYPFEILSKEKMDPYLALIKTERESAAATGGNVMEQQQDEHPQPPQGEEEEEAPMEME